MNIAILGFGSEGKTLLAFLKKHPRYKKAVITVLDRNEGLASELKKLGIPYRLGIGYLKDVASFDTIFRSPGIPYLTPEIQNAVKKGVTVSSQTKLFFEELYAARRNAKSAKPTVIGVTGTKGKGTTSTLIFQMLKKAKYKAVLAGNMGKPMIESLAAAKKADYVILELSSFQLHDIAVSPDIAVVLDIFPDHLDTHKDLREYYDAKANIGRFQKKSGRIFFYTTNAGSVRIAAKSPARKHGITPKQDNLRKNFEMAAAVARTCGCSGNVIEKTIKGFTGIEHRLELVKKIKSITFYNDSAGTNPVATAAAILSFKEPVVLIAGGKDKGLSYAALAAALKKSTVELVVLFGENREKIASEVQSAKRTIVMANDLKEALKMAFDRAKELAAQKESAIIVFSPAAASFDMFANYKERGEMYKKTVNALR
ncbi:MAG: UDP-N-acetylmuramoyl-L-alanine--D-glutamate ligase [Candidatus Pacebacteria bacterium]|nr:UDP-N-acetylmuramoyl-L-alanine--D-glutamate ligase [Candidatus Paceibacterota bacterium]